MLSAQRSRAVCRKNIRRCSLKRSSEGADIETLKASIGVEIGKGVSPSPTAATGLGSFVSSPSLVRAKTRPQSPFQNFLSVTERRTL